MKISNFTLHGLFFLFLILINSLVFSSRLQANPACGYSDYLMQVRCRELQEFDQRNEQNRRMYIRNVQEREKQQEREEQQKALIVVGGIIGLVVVGTLFFKSINQRKSKSDEV